MKAQFLTLLLSTGLITGPALALESAPSAKDTHQAARVAAPPPIAEAVTCFRPEVESGSAPAECLAIRNTLKGIHYVYIVVPTQARLLEIQRAKVIP